ncbi:MAG TPA: hydantoinase/oxoprolinase family protein [Candidatus Binatia bacterium]|jgi:N-methylhydantoinase A|nr:hydantoinase/oxoprolinase family protein [Candidatus Binatia bacterium]
MKQQTYRVGVDIGGTFTDLFLLSGEGEVAIGKVLTTPRNPAEAVVDGLRTLLREQGIAPAAVTHLVHGTTLITNAIIERKGAKTGLITTKGFRDALEIGRERRYDIYDISLENPEPLVPRLLRREVNERLDNTGLVVTPLNPDEALEVIRGLVADGIEALAVCLLHSFRNPVHELLIKKLVAEHFPHLACSLSCEVMPEIREYERTSTTVANVYVKPLAQQYLSKLNADLRVLGLPRDIFIMLSNGGITSCGVAGEYPIRLIESGPAAGALAAVFYGTRKKLERVISFDMGGTTAKICLIDRGKPLLTTDFEAARVYRFKKGSGLPLKVPVIEMIEIGAGGGSIARVDKLGLLKVGPDSAGAEPGPVCYDRGGEEPTVTDADLVLGYLSPEYFLGGKMRLNLAEAKRAIADKIARPLKVDLLRAAWGIHQVVNENMANAARMHLVEKGRDPRDYNLIAFGGAGPVHAYRVAERLKLKTLVCPLAAGVTSAFGMLTAPLAFDFVQSYVTSLSDLDFTVLERLYADMEKRGRDLLAAAGVEGEITLTRSADMRYLQQGFEIRVPLPSRRLTPDDLPDLRRAFAEEYERLYKRLNPGVEIEVVNWRLIASGPPPQITLRPPAAAGRSLTAARKGERPVYLPEHNGFVPCSVYDRYLLPVGASFSGPAVVEERECTVVIGPDAHVNVDEEQNLVIML